MLGRQTRRRKRKIVERARKKILAAVKRQGADEETNALRRNTRENENAAHAMMLGIRGDF